MTTQKAAAPEAIRARPGKNANMLRELTPTAPQAQERPVAIWRVLAWPKKFGCRCADTSGKVFAALDRILAGGDYLWLIAADGRALALVDGEFFEALRRAAYAYAEPLQLVYDSSVRGISGGAL